MSNPYIDLIERYPDAFIPDLFLLLAVVAGLINLKVLSKSLLCLFALVFLSLVVETIIVYNAAHRINNHYLVNVTSVIETVCIAAMYGYEVDKRGRTVIALLTAVYLFLFFNTFDWLHFAEYSLGVQRLLMIIFVLLHFGNILKENVIPNLLRYTMFWVSVGVLMYATGTLFIFLFTKLTFSEPTMSSDFRFYLQVFRFFACFFYLNAIIGFWIRRWEVARQ